MKSKLVAVLASLIVGTLGAADAAAQAQEETSAGVARISLIHGEVSTQRGDSGDWGAAALNAPLVSGDKVSTGDNSRAEVQLDYANILRLGHHSQATIASLTHKEIQVQVGQGIVNYEAFKNSEANAEIDTPNVAVHPGRSDDSVRIEVKPDGDTDVIVRRGDVEVSTPQGSTHVDKGQMVTVRGTGDQTQYKVAEAPSRDDWDTWNSDRDGVIRNAQSWGHTDRYYTGAEDLDAYGRWETVPDYGPVWIPAAGPGWAPYRAGRWVWEPYWGWTWVSYEPWGWAPYHYGRWFFYGASWVWWPGPVYGYGYGHPYRPIWAPAYVSFFGFGGGVGVGVGFGSFGWLPIGPCDHFYPWWGGYRNHFNVVNVTNVTVINNFHHDREFGGFAPLHGGTAYSNVRLAATDARIRGGMSTVPAEHFGRGGFEARPVDAATFHGGHIMAGNLPVVPSHESLRASDRPASAGTMRGGQNEHFFGTRPAAAHQPFDHQATQMQQAIQRDGRFTAVNNNMRTNPGANTQERGSFANNRPNSNAPMPSNAGRSEGNVARGNAPTANTNNGGWSRFGGARPSNQQQSIENNSSNRAIIPRPNQNSPAQSSGTNQDRGGWRTFSNSGQGGSPGNNVPRPSSSMNSAQGRFESNGPVGRINSNGPSVNNAPRPENSSSGRSSGGWQPFTPQPRSAASDNNRSSGGNSYPHPGNSGNSSPNYSGGRSGGGSGSYGSPRSYSRPPLDMRQPVVTPRAYSSAPSGGGRPSNGSGGGSHGGYSGGGGGGSSHSGGGNPGGGHSSSSSSPHSGGNHR